MSAREYVRLALARSEHLTNLALERYRSLSKTGKTAVWVWALLHFVFGALFWLIGPERIFAWFAGLADEVREMPNGWLLLSLVIVITSIPPLVGYGTAQTLVGFAYGVLPGFYISAGSCLVGGAVAFLVVRRLIGLFAPYIQRDKTFAALSRAVRVKGLPLIVLLRLCPFPYPYSNAFFASIETVSLQEFLLATLAITPKLLLHVFIGHRTYLFADPASRHKMDSTTRWINGIFMVVGTLLGIGTSWYLYKLTMRYVEEAAEGDEQDALEAGLLQDVDELLDGVGTSGGEDEEGTHQHGRGGGEAEPEVYDGSRAVSSQKQKQQEAAVTGVVPEGDLLDVGTEPEPQPEPNPRPTRPPAPAPALGRRSLALTDEDADGWGDAFSDYSGREGGRGDSIELDSRSTHEKTAARQGRGHARGDSAAWGLDDDDDGGEEEELADLGDEGQGSPAVFAGLPSREKKRID
ncbi:hypothetical protein JCM10908_001584 [Rhodotorula pacifica]|uniref:TVP38/TMEM64 family protein n=1 Tax=Rhodotorula pacifica TaxID=1495444 RepID=UPI00316DBCB9